MRLWTVTFFLLTTFTHALAIENPSSELKKVAITPSLGAVIDLSLPFTDSDGRVQPLSVYFEERPVLLLPVYYNCPRLCGLILNGAFEMITAQTLKMGEDFEVVAFSINPDEKQELAKTKSEAYAGELAGRDGPLNKTIKGWHFLVGDEAQIKALTSQLGFHYLPDGEEDYAHGAALYVMTPRGEISQYYTGVIYEPSAVRLSLVEASANKIGNLLDHAMLFCYKFDVTKGKYTWAVARLLQFTAAISILLLGTLIWSLLRVQKKSTGK